MLLLASPADPFLVLYASVVVLRFCCHDTRYLSVPGSSCVELASSQRAKNGDAVKSMEQ